MIIRKFLHKYLKPAGDGDGGGGSVDRGDDFTPTGDDADGAQDELSKAERAAEAAAAEIEAAEKAKKPDAKADDAKADDEDDIDPENPDADDEKPKKKDSRIPLSRHEKILAREREQRQAAEERLAQYEKGQKVATLNEDLTKLEDSVLTMEREYTKLLAEGEIDKATEMMSKIRRTERQIVDAQADYRSQVAIAQATEQARYDVALERIEESYPALNPDSDDFDKATLGEVVEWKVFYEKQRNMTPTKALQAAVKKVVGADTSSQQKATTVAPKVDAEDVADKAKELAKERKKAAVAKAVDTNNKTPASTTKVGLDSDKAGGSLTAKDVMKMSQEDFRKLPDDVLARMRGDEFV